MSQYDQYLQTHNENRRKNVLNKQMFRLTAKKDYKDENVTLVKGDEVFTYRPKNWVINYQGEELINLKI